MTVRTTPTDAVQAVFPDSRCVGALLREQARRQPRALAILAPGRSPLDYQGLWEQVLYVAATLQSLGISNQTRVAAVLQNGPEMAVAFLGVAACAICAPMNLAGRASEYRFFLEDIGAQALIVHKGYVGAARSVAEEMRLTVIEIEVTAAAHAGQFEIVAKPPPRGVMPGFAGPDDIALILHTSGTTARPKVVPLRHSNLMASAGNIAGHLALSSSDCCLNVMPLFHIHGLVGALLASLTGGGCIVCAPGFDAGNFFDWIAEFQPSWYTAVPTIHQAVIARAERYREKAPNHRFRFVRSSSSSLPPSTMKQLEDSLGAPVIEAYSMTEASHQMTSNPLPPAARIPGSVGVAVGVEIAIMDAAGRKLAAGQRGEIVVRGRSVIQAYENNPGANASAFTDGWFRTGDQGYLDERAYLFISGRLKEVVNRGGEKVSPREVDDLLMEHDSVAQAAAFGMPHPALGEDLAAVAVLKPGAKATESELRAFLATRLSEFKVPTRILLVDTIPKGPTGKVQRTLLHQKLGTLFGSQFIAPSSDIELGLAAAWEKTLGVPHVGINDNFFELGGTSIAVLRLVVEMERATGIKFELGDVFRFPTIAELVAHSRSGAGKGASVVVPLREKGDGIPIFCIYGINIYKDFAESLGNGQPVYGVYVREEQLILSQLVDGYRPEISITRLVEAYDDAVARFRPHGPYRLAGFSLGGIMAFELAKRLRARGEIVDLVILLDTVLAHGARRNWGRWLSHLAAELIRGGGTRYLHKLFARLIGRSEEHMPQPATHGQGTGDDEITAKQLVAFRQAARRWRPAPTVVDFRVVLFRATDSLARRPFVDLQEDYGWGRYVGELSIVRVPGEHRSLIERPGVCEVGRCVLRYLEPTLEQ